MRETRTTGLLTVHPPSRDKHLRGQVRAHGFLPSQRLACDLCQGTVLFSLNSCKKRLSSVSFCTFALHKNLSQNLSEFKCDTIMVISRCFRLPPRPARSIGVKRGAVPQRQWMLQTMRSVQVLCLFVVAALFSDATILAPLYTLLSFGVPFSHFCFKIMFQTYC